MKAHVRRIAVVDTYRFSVVAKSKKKTDRADAAALARFLRLGWLPEVPVASEQVRVLRQLLQARETLISMRTKLKNMAHATFSRNGIALTRAAFASASSRGRLSRRDDLPASDLLVLRAALRQTRADRRGGRATRSGDHQAWSDAQGAAAAPASTWAEPAVSDQSAGGGRRHRALRHLEAVGRLRRPHHIHEAVERDDEARRDHQAREEAAEDGLHPSGAGDGQPDGHALDGVLSEEEAGEGGWQGDLRHRPEAAYRHLRAVEEGTGLLVLGRPLVQPQAAGAQCRGLSLDFA